MLSMVFSTSVFAAEQQQSALESFLGLFSAKAETTVGVEYRGHVQNKGDFPLDGSWITGPNQLGTVGEGLRLEAFWIQLTDVPEGLHIQYQVHVQNIGWMDAVEDGALAGTQGQGLRIEAIKISLVDDAGNAAVGYSVEYKGHVQNIGDTQWYKDGEQLGTTGSGFRLEALEVQIVQTQTDLSAYEAAVAKAEAVEETDYTAASYAALQTALEDNVVTVDNTQAEVDAATAAINAAYDALVPAPAEPEISSLTATGAYELTIAFNKAVDTDAATITVKRGLTSATISDIEWNDNNSEAVLTLSSKIKEGTYTATVAGLSEDYLTATVDTEDEAVADINFLSTNLVASNDDLTVATATFEVLNQYGEDVTDDTIAANIEAATSLDVDTIADGVLTANFEANEADLGDTYNVTLYDDESSVTEKATLTLVDVATADEITIGDVYNEDGDTLSLDNVGDEFYLLLTLVDQYGDAITSEDVANADLKIKTSDSDVLSVPTYSSTTNAQITTIDIDDVDYLAVPLTIGTDADDVTITVMSKGSGTTASVDLTVEAGAAIDTVVIGTPDVTVAGDSTINIPVEVTDNDGNAVTEIGDLFENDSLVLDAEQAGVDVDADWTEEDGQIYITVQTATVDEDETQTLRVEVTTPTDEYTYKTFKVKPDSIPEAIVELSSDVSRALLVGLNTEIDYEDFVVEDQYGNVMDPDDYEISADSITGYTVTDGADPLVINASGTPTSGTIEFVLTDVGSTTELDTLSVKFTAVEATEFASYTVSDFGTVYAADGVAAYGVPLKVYGVTSSGKSVLLPANEGYYSVATNTNYLTNATVGDDTLLYGESDLLYSAAHTSYPETKAVTATVTINATGASLSAAGTVSVVAPDLTTIQVVKDNFADADLQTATLTEVSSINVAGGSAIGYAELLAGTYGTASTPITIVATDTYGVRGELTLEGSAYVFNYPTDVASTLTFTLVSDDVLFNNNGTASANVTEYAAGNSFNAIVNGDGISANTLKVKATAGYNAATTTARTALSTALTTANTLNTATVASADGTDVDNGSYWALSANKTTYTAAIAAAQTVYNNASATATQLTTATTTLTTATATFTGQRTLVTVSFTALNTAITAANTNNATAVGSADGTDVANGASYVPTAAKIAYETAIDDAETVAADTTATQDEVDAAATALTTATATFNTAKLVASTVYTSLDATITSATALENNTTTSVDGTDVVNTHYWVTEANMTTFTSAISSATIVSNDLTATQDEVDAANTALQAAYIVFNSQRALGTQ